MLKAHARFIDSFLHCVDAGIAVAIYLLLVPSTELLGAAGDDVGIRVVTLGIASALAWPVLLDMSGLYESFRLRGIVSIARRFAVAGIVAAIVLWAGKWLLSARLPLEFPVVCAAVQTAALLGFRVSAMISLRWVRRSGMNVRNVLILGSGPRAFQVADLIDQNKGWGLRVIGFADVTDTPAAPELHGVPIHKFVDLPSLLNQSVIDEAIVAVPRSVLSEAAPAVATCAEAGVPVSVLADLFGGGLPQPRPARLASRPTLSFSTVSHGRFQLGFKRLFDIAVSSTLLVLLAPLFGALALGVRRSSPGPVLFRQTRVGLYGRRFGVLKFRTMYEDAEERLADLQDLNEMDGPVFKMKDDPRITPIGKRLRKWSLDELPQLWNVLRGEMSLVGPRPPLPSEVAQYSTMERRRLSMRPGITCIWQVSGRNDIRFADWVKLDLQYIDRWSLALDMQILGRTIPAVLGGTGR